MTTQPKSRFVKFNPEINTGTIVQIFVIIAGIFFGYSDLKTRQDVQATRIEGVNVQLLAISQELKEIAKGQNALAVDVAVLRGRAAESNTNTSSGGKR